MVIKLLFETYVPQGSSKPLIVEYLVPWLVLVQYL